MRKNPESKVRKEPIELFEEFISAFKKTRMPKNIDWNKKYYSHSKN